jgi:hypothetical protein
MSIAQNYPNVSPQLLIDLANTQRLDPRLTFARASVGTYYDENGVLQTASSGVARLQFDPVTGESLGLLRENQATNLVTYSEQLIMLFGRRQEQQLLLMQLWRLTGR